MNLVLADINITALQAFAETVSRSKLLGIQKPEDVLVIMLTGTELGLKPMQALRGIHIISGKPVLSADLLMAVALRHPDCIRFCVVEMTAERATVEVMRRGWEGSARYSFSREDAQTAGLWGRGNWKTYPSDMLKARAISRAARAAFADALLGVYVEGELDDPTTTLEEREEVEVIEVAPAKPKKSREKSEMPQEWKDLNAELWGIFARAGLSKDESEAARTEIKRRLKVASLKDVPASKLNAVIERILKDGAQLRTEEQIAAYLRELIANSTPQIATDTTPAPSLA